MSGHILLTVQTAVLVLVTLAVLYPVVAYARNVMHTRAVVLIAVALLAFSVSAAVGELFGMGALAEGIHLLANASLAGAVWLFAREFVRTGEEPEAFADHFPGGALATADDEGGVDGGFADADHEGPAVGTTPRGGFAGERTDESDGDGGADGQ